MEKLNFESGTTIFIGWDNVDIQKPPKLTKSFDFNEFPYPLNDDYYDLILIDNVLEHLKDHWEVLDELWKKCKNNAIIKIIVPYYYNNDASGSMQHKCYFSDHTFKSYVKEQKQINPTKKYRIKKLILLPTNVGRKLPKTLREKFSLFIGGLIAQVHVDLEVIKENKKETNDYIKNDKKRKKFQNSLANIKVEGG